MIIRSSIIHALHLLYKAEASYCLSYQNQMFLQISFGASVSYFYILRVFQTVDFIARFVIADLACVDNERVFTNLGRSVVDDSIKVARCVHGSDIVCLIWEKFCAWVLEQIVETLAHHSWVIDWSS